MRTNYYYDHKNTSYKVLFSELVRGGDLARHEGDILSRRRHPHLLSRGNSAEARDADDVTRRIEVYS